MELSEADIFVIKTIANYTFYDKMQKEGIITNDMFTNSYEEFSDIQRKIVSYFIAEETDLIQSFTGKLEK